MRPTNDITYEAGEVVVGYDGLLWPAVAGAAGAVSLRRAVEADLAHEVNVRVEPVVHLGFATEADSAFPIAIDSTPTVRLAVASEADVVAAPLAIATDRAIELGPASETDAGTDLEVTTEERAQIAVAWIGAVTSTSAVVKARIQGDEAILTAQPGGIEVEGVEVADHVFAFALDELEPDTKYSLRILAPGEEWTGTFRTFPEGPASFRVAFGGDSGHSGGDYDVNGVSPDAPTWDAIAAMEPLLFVHMGDLHYRNISSNNLAAFRQAYRDVLQGKCSAMSRAVPWAYVWDDHDYGSNDSHGGSASKPAAAQAYREFVPHYPLPASDGFGVWHTFTAGRVRFIITDGRSQRSPRSAPDNASKVLMGPEQEAWLDSVLAEAAEEVIILVLPNPWIQAPTSGSDSWGGYTTERTRIAKLFTKHGVTSRLLIVSADAHMMAMDDGSNSQYDPAATTAGPRLFHCGGIDAGKIAIGGPYSEGQAATNKRQIFGTVEIEDDGENITVTCKGWSVDAAGNATLEQAMSFVAGQIEQHIPLALAQEVDDALELALRAEPILTLATAVETDTAVPADIQADPALDLAAATEDDAAAPLTFRIGDLPRYREVGLSAGERTVAVTATTREVRIQ